MKIRLGLGAMSMADAAKHCGGDLLGAVRGFEYICTDSREADEKTLFIATRGERVDGHNYIGAAQGLGCRCFLCERVPEGENCDSCFCVVENSLESFSMLARGYRAKAPLDVVAITGSVGKTTTKELVSRVLREGSEVYCTEGNFNSTIGMPMSMLEVVESIQTAVFEMGMSARGEISLMSRTARPRVALITNIGSSHLEYLGTRENIAQAKLEIADGLVEGGVLIINGDEPLLTDATKNYSEKGIRVMLASVSGNGDFCAERIRATRSGSLFDMRYGDECMTDIFVPAIGKHIVYDALLAAAVGVLFGLSREQINSGLSSYAPGTNRQRIIPWEDKTVIADCYNAAPESVRSALEVLVTIEGDRKIAVLGDMKELGAGEIELHREVGTYVAMKKIDVLITVGELARHIAEGAEGAGMSKERIFTLNSNAEAAHCISENAEPSDVVLLKASRSMRFEEILEGIMG